MSDNGLLYRSTYPVMVSDTNSPHRSCWAPFSPSPYCGAAASGCWPVCRLVRDLEQPALQSAYVSPPLRDRIPATLYSLPRKRPISMAAPQASGIQMRRMSFLVSSRRSSTAFARFSRDFISRLLEYSAWATSPRCHSDRLRSPVDISFWAFTKDAAVASRPFTVAAMPDWRKCWRRLSPNDWLSAWNRNRSRSREATRESETPTPEHTRAFFVAFLLTIADADRASP